ncbi:MAG: DUF5951 family protein [Yokenella regensburgei]|uniref:DUF5951 family protein n=1 Tax=Yokenella regensburgei TaxID=158877 RepID=UPI001C685D86|nr:DUF5951 family protein [Yokenella regensburgei]
MEAYLSGEKNFVKPQFPRLCSTASSVYNLSSFAALFITKTFCSFRDPPSLFEM